MPPYCEILKCTKNKKLLINVDYVIGKRLIDLSLFIHHTSQEGFKKNMCSIKVILNTSSYYFLKEAFSSEITLLITTKDSDHPKNV